jgi:hypothetical protein
MRIQLITIRKGRDKALSTNTAKRPEFLQKMMAAAPAPRHEPEVEEADKSLKEMRLAIPTPMLDVVFRDGKVRSFSYAYLSEVEFEPGDTLTLKFTSGAAIIVEGRGLARHRQSVRLHRADELKEGSEIELELDGRGIAVIEKIHITEGEMK